MNLDVYDVVLCLECVAVLENFAAIVSGERASRAVLCRHAENILSTRIVGGNAVSAQSLGRDVPNPIWEGHFLLGAGGANGRAWKSSGGGYGQRP